LTDADPAKEYLDSYGVLVEYIKQHNIEVYLALESHAESAQEKYDCRIGRYFTEKKSSRSPTSGDWRRRCACTTANSDWFKNLHPSSPFV
jgi:hypothetical protein